VDREEGKISLLANGGALRMGNSIESHPEGKVMEGCIFCP
jgi:hypothetical protein